MATNTELKNQIDSQIKNKTAPSSITKSNVADNMKQIVDYVDQEVSAIPVSVPGPTGPQGIQGNTGLTGPQGIAGNSGSLPYQVYTAYLEFVDGTTINSTVFQNTIGDGSKDGINDIAWSYHSAAQPKAIMTSAPFTLNKTLASNNIYGINMNLQGERKSSTEVRFYSNDINNSSASLSFVPFVFVEIKVYN